MILYLLATLIFVFVNTSLSGSLIGHPVENVRVTLTDGASHAVDSSELAFKLAAIYAFRKVRFFIPCFYSRILSWSGTSCPSVIIVIYLSFILLPEPITIGGTRPQNVFHRLFLCQCYTAARPVILEPVMLVEVKVPTEFQGTVGGDINKWVVYCFDPRSPGFFTICSTFLKVFVTLFYGRRKGIIVGNDQDGDDSIITAHVSSFSFCLCGWFYDNLIKDENIRFLVFFGSFFLDLLLICTVSCNSFNHLRIPWFLQTILCRKQTKSFTNPFSFYIQNWCTNNHFFVAGSVK